MAGAAACIVLSRRGQAQPLSPRPDPDCLRCHGTGRTPLLDAKPFYWLKGTPQPRLSAAVGDEFCPLCQEGRKADEIAAEPKQWLATALVKNKQWEERTGWKLGCIVTRHATIHTQLTTVQNRAVGAALETLASHLKRTTDSLALTTTRPDTLELMILWEKPSWDHFRKVMEQLYPREQLGPSWGSAKVFNAYDHQDIPHLYETPQSLKSRPPSCGATFIVGRRQVSLATDWRAPFWLAEGFAAYSDRVVHNTNRWYTVYSVKEIPVGDWLADARKLAADGKLLPWKDMVARELRDWEARDHVQTMAAAAFLLDSEPARFLKLLRRLRGGEPETAALEETYRGTLEEIDQRFAKWLAAR
jgi:hypothetical protein